LSCLTKNLPQKDRGEDINSLRCFASSSVVTSCSVSMVGRGYQLPEMFCLSVPVLSRMLWPCPTLLHRLRLSLARSETQEGILLRWGGWLGWLAAQGVEERNWLRWGRHLGLLAAQGVEEGNRLR